MNNLELVSAAYIIRCKPHGSNREDQFLGGRISIGWPCGANLQGKKRSDIAECLKDKYGDNPRDLTETAVSMVDTFVNIPVGAIVLTPSLKNKLMIHIFRVTSTYQYDASADSDEVGNPHFVNAELIRTVPRISLPSVVVRSLSGARKTVSDISQHTQFLHDFIDTDCEIDEMVVLDHENFSDLQLEAYNVLAELLRSSDDQIRLASAVAILNTKPIV